MAKSAANIPNSDEDSVDSSGDDGAAGPSKLRIDVDVPGKRRSRVTIIGRTLLACLLVVLVNEGHARYFYGKSLEAIRDAVAAHREVNPDADDGLPLAEVEPLVSGLPRRLDRYYVSDPVRLITYFSLFRTYAIRLELDEHRNIDTLETGAWKEGRYSVEPVTIGQHLEASGYDIPRRPGYSSTTGDVVQLDFGLQLNHRRANYGYPSNLHRELFRQAFLIAARDELQLGTRDVNFGESILMVKQPRDGHEPLHLFVQNRPRIGGYNLFLGQGSVDALTDVAELVVELPPDSSVEVVVAEAERLSRTVFVEWLGKAVFSGKANKVVKTGALPDVAVAAVPILNSVAQLTVLRSVHSAIRSQGESPERLTALSGAYAVYGELADHFLAPIPDAARARALLYAERLIHRSPDLAIAHFGRARVRTIVGLHSEGLEDIEQGRVLQNQSDGVVGREIGLAVDDWLETIEASCHGDVAALLRQTQTPGTRVTAPLAALLRMQHATALADHASIAVAAERMLALEPAQALALSRLAAGSSSGSETDRLENALAAHSRMISEYSQRLTGFDDATRKFMASVPESVEDCVAWRVALRDQLGKLDEQIADGNVDDDGEPSLSALEGFVRQTGFLQAVHSIESQHYPRNFTPQERIDLYFPLAAGHDYDEWFLSYSPDSQVAWDALRSSWSMNTPLYSYWSRNCTRLVDLYEAWTLSRIGINRRRKTMVESTSGFFQDLAWKTRHGESRDQCREAARELAKVSPDSEASTVALLTLDWARIEEQVETLEERFARSPKVQMELGRGHLQSMRFDDAERCLKRSLSLRPDREVARLLAECYLEQDDEDRWLIQMRLAGQLESDSLESYSVSSEIAYTLLSRGKPQRALPFAVRAASSNSQWGIDVLATCHEALGDFSKAYNYRRQSAEAYGDALSLYFWCRRTGRGNLPEATAGIAGETLAGLKTAESPKRCAVYLVYSMINDDPLPGLSSLLHALRYGAVDEGPWSRLLIEQAYYDYGKTVPDRSYEADNDNKVLPPYSQEEMSERRLQMTMQCLFNCQDAGLATEPAQFYIELRRSIIDPAKQPLNLKRMDWIIRNYGAAGSRTNMWYFIGKVLLREGRKDEAIRYFKLAASSRYSYKYNAVLAGHELVKLGLKAEPVRPTEFEGDEASLIRWYDAASVFGAKGEVDRAILRLEKIVELDATWAPAHFYLAGLRRSQGNEHLAIEHFDEAIRLEPEQPDIRVSRGRAFYAIGNLEGSIADYKKALELEPGYEDAHWLLGMIRAAAPDDELRDGAAAVRHAESIDHYGLNREYDRHELLAAAHAENGDFEAAAQFFEKSSAKSAGGYDAYRQRAADYKAGKPYRLKVPVEMSEE